MEEIDKIERIRLSVIDDHPVIFWGVKMALKAHKFHPIDFVNQYSCAKATLDNLENLDSDVLLIDMRLPDMKGYELARIILETYPEMKIGMYTSTLCKNDILNSFKYGALGYLPKTADAKEIIDFIVTINKGGRYFKGEVADIIFESQVALDKQKETTITKREIEILRLILAGYRNREIAEKLSISERTVEFHKQNIYMKLEVNNALDLMKKAIRSNLIYTKDLLE